MTSSTAIDPALQAEYYHLQKTIEDFDGRALTIKAWSVTFGFAALAGAFASKSAVVFLIASAAGLLFWLLEAMWKAFQLGYYERVLQIEAHFRGERPLEVPHQISATWQSWWMRGPWAVVRRVSIWPHVALPHGAVILVGVLCYLFVTFRP